MGAFFQNSPEYYPIFQDNFHFNCTKNVSKFSIFLATFYASFKFYKEWIILFNAKHNNVKYQF